LQKHFGGPQDFMNSERGITSQQICLLRVPDPIKNVCVVVKKPDKTSGPSPDPDLQQMKEKL